MPTPKELTDMTVAEFGQLFPIMVHAYSDQWPSLYKKEKMLLLELFTPAEIVSIDHIGSTAIPGLMAKPTIDILMQVSEQIEIQKLEHTFQSLDYKLTKQSKNAPLNMTFVKGYTNLGFSGQTYHVHVRNQGDWDEIRFRDFLLNNYEVAKEYEMLKVRLAAMYKNDREKYTNSKTDFIKRINKLTRKQ